jgi:NOL1/NOP2/fmu family ribosome biogenesis protein
LPALKEEGVLIYSTCSYSMEEDEQICDELIAGHQMIPIELQLPEEWGIVHTRSKKGAYGYRFFPHLLNGEGFFLACFRKAGGSSETVSHNKNSKRNNLTARVSKEEEKIAAAFILEEDLSFLKVNDEIVGCKREIEEELMQVVSALKVKKWPLHLGQVKGKDFIPHPFSAYLQNLTKEIPREELDTETALRYLRKQNVEFKGDKGLTLVTYKGFGLGWAKNLGNRVNNYFPAEWRILKEEF